MFSFLVPGVRQLGTVNMSLCIFISKNESVDSETGFNEPAQRPSIWIEAKNPEVPICLC